LAKAVEGSARPRTNEAVRLLLQPGLSPQCSPRCEQISWWDHLQWVAASHALHSVRSSRRRCPAWLQLLGGRGYR